MLATGIQVDTLLLGGYASGDFDAAVDGLAGGMPEAERVLVGEHLQRIFADVLRTGGLERTGRLRVAYERLVRPDGSTRSVRVLGAQIAVAGRQHTAYFFETSGRPGYFDPFGRPLDGGGWSGPLERARVSSPFGSRRMHPILNRVLPHTGVDLAAATGTPVRATADGLVTRSGDAGGYGLLVELQHPNGYSTRYAHLSRIDDRAGRARVVRQGDVIGYVGMTGLATGPHLHYEVRRQGQPTDPLRLGPGSGPAADAGGQSASPRERRRIEAILARAPTLAQTD